MMDKRQLAVQAAPDVLCHNTRDRRHDGWRLKPRLRAFSEGRKARLRGLQTGANGTSDGQRCVQPATAGFVAERSEAVQAQLSHTCAQQAPSGGAYSAARAGGLCGAALRRGFSRQHARGFVLLLLALVLSS